MEPFGDTLPTSGAMEQSSTPTVVQLNATGFPGVQSQPGEAERRAEGVQSRMVACLVVSPAPLEQESVNSAGREDGLADREPVAGTSPTPPSMLQLVAFSLSHSRTPVPPGESTQLAENIETTGFSGTVAIARPAALAASMVNGTGSSGDGMRMVPSADTGPIP